MKRLFFALFMSLPMVVMAQDNTWERVETSANSVNPDQKYLAGAVPEVDGKVVFKTTVDAPGKSAQQVYDIVLDYMKKLVHEPNQFEQSRVVLEDKGRQVGATLQEWLVFKSTALQLDRTRLLYNLIVDCADGKADVTMSRINYIYDEERDDFCNVRKIRWTHLGRWPASALSIPTIIRYQQIRNSSSAEKEYHPSRCSWYRKNL